MPYALGIDLAGDRLTAAMTRFTSNSWTKPEIFRPGEYPFAGCVDRVGDEVPVIVSGRPYPAHWLVAELVIWLLQQVTAGRAEQLVISHPGGWGTYRRFLLSEALREVELPDAMLVAQPVAAAAQSQGTVGVYTPRSTAVVRGGELLACHDCCDLAEPTERSLARTVKSVGLRLDQLQRVLVVGGEEFSGFPCPVDRFVEPAAGAAVLASRAVRPVEVTATPRRREGGAVAPRPPVTVTSLSLPKKRVLQLGRK